MKQIEGHNLNATSDRRSKKPSSLFLVLVIPLLLQISAAVGLTSWLSIRSGKKAIEQLANQLMGEVGDRIQENLRTKLEIPHQLNRLNANLIELELLPTDNQALIGKHFFRQIQEFENIAYIYMGNPKGGLVSVQKSREANRLYFQLTQDFVKNDLINYAINASGNPETATENFGPYDATIRPWYAAAIETGKPIWSDTYIDAVTKKPLTRAVLPIYDNGGEILAVLAADIEIFEELNQLLGSLKIRQSGAIFIIQRTGELLASSLVESSSTSKNDEAILPQGAYSSSALIRTALKEAEAQIPNFQKIEEVRNFSFVLDGEKQFARVLPFQDERGLDWLIFIDVPESEFMAEIYAQERTTFLLCLLALAIASGAGVVTVRWLTQPLRKLNLAARDLAAGQWDRTVSINRNDEVGELAVAFNSMAKQLKSSFETLEKRVRDRTPEPEVAKEKAEVANITKSSFLSPCQIVIVDDTRMNLHLLSHLLMGAGYEVRSFSTGQLALEGIADSPPNLVLLDIQMPEMDGYEVCEKLKADKLTRNIPVIFISALNETFDKVKAFEVGGVDYITKPFQAKEVLARVATHLEMYQMKKKLQKVNVTQAQKLVEKNRRLVELNRALKKTNRELQNHYKQLQHAQLQLVQAEKMATLGNLVAGVAHEINNPVGFIDGNIKPSVEYIQDLLEHLRLYQKIYANPESEVLEHADDIDLEFIVEDLPKSIASMKEGVERIRNISTSLRTFSRTDAVAKVPFNLHNGLDSTLLILKHRLKGNQERPSIEIIKKYGELPEIECFPGQLNQVFMNLLANALDALDHCCGDRCYAYIEKNPYQIEITTEMKDDKVLVRIRDNGVGMSEEVKSQIFEQGFTTKPVGEGTGLGMAIAREIVEEKHGGTLTCVSELGKGTEFIIEIPLVINN